jgi:hypothetical protein
VLLQLVAQALHFGFHQVDLLRELDGAALETRARNALVWRCCRGFRATPLRLLGRVTSEFWMSKVVVVASIVCLNLLGITNATNLQKNAFF